MERGREGCGRGRSPPGAGGGANRVNTSAVRRVGRRVEIAYQHGGCLSEPTITLAPQL
jgi:hypothetical protein